MDKSDKIKVLIQKTNNIEVVDLENVIGDNENNIFFIESNNNLTKFHPRLLCAFESAAIHNPEEMVWHKIDLTILMFYLLHLCINHR